MRARGFTLVELLVVLAILTLVMASIPPFLAGGQARAELSTSARAIAAALRETRSRAIREGRSEAFVVDGTAGAFGSAGGAPVRRVSAGLRLSLLTLANKRLDVAIIRFFGDGSSTGGSITVRQGERRSDVTVDWLTGRVSLAAR